MTTFSDAVAASDPAVILAVTDAASAEILLSEYVRIGEEMQAADADGRTLGDVMDMIDAQIMVLLAARRVSEAETALADAQEWLAAAKTALAAASDEEYAAAEAEVAEAQAAVDAAGKALARARAAFREARRAAADMGARMRWGLLHRHGGIAEAHITAPVYGASRDFYEEDVPA